MTSEDVVVFSDNEGNLYTLTPELLEMARVHDEGHKQRIHSLLSGSGEVQGYQIGQPLLGLQLIGAYPRPQDALILQNYFAPSFKPALGPAPPS